MAPESRIQWMGRNPIGNLKPKRAGVMAAFYPDSQGETRFLLILRKVYEGVHSGQIGFPGGKWEEGDRGMLDTALRETNEEVGIPPGDIEVIRELSELYIPPSNFMVRPFMGLYPDPKPFVLDPFEVEELVEVRLGDFMDGSNRFVENLSTSYAEKMDVPAYRLNGYTVWGATAMILGEIQELLRMAH